MRYNFNDFMSCCVVAVDGLPQLASSRIIYSTELNLSLECVLNRVPQTSIRNFSENNKLRQNGEEKVEWISLFLDQTYDGTIGWYFVKRDHPS